MGEIRSLDRDQPASLRSSLIPTRPLAAATLCDLLTLLTILTSLARRAQVSLESESLKRTIFDPPDPTHGQGR